MSFDFEFLFLTKPKKDIVQTSDVSTASSPVMDTQRTLGVLLGLQAAYQARGTSRSPEEEEYHDWLKSEFFAGGLQVLQPKNQFEEEKGESRGSASGGTTPGKLKFVLHIHVYKKHSTVSHTHTPRKNE